MKGKKIHHLALAHIMHAPHKAYNFRLKERYAEIKGKGNRYAGRGRDMQRGKGR
jgi:hypothetical protein